MLNNFTAHVILEFKSDNQFLKNLENFGSMFGTVCAPQILVVVTLLGIYIYRSPKERPFHG